MYIGAKPNVANFVMLDSITTSATATFNLTKDGVAYYPPNSLACIVSLNGIVQKATSSFNIVNNTIVFSQALTSNDVIDYILVMAEKIDLSIPADASVTNAKTNFVSTSSNAGLQIKGDGTTDGTLQLNCSQNSHGIKLKSPPHSASASYTLTLPNNDGNNEEFLQTNGSGVLTWATAGGGAKTLLNTTTVSSDVSHINFDNSLITSTYKVYEIIIEFLQTDASSGNEIQMAYSNDNGSSFENGLDEMLTRDRNNDVSTDVFRNTSTNQSQHHISSGLQTSTEAFMSGVIKIFQPMTSALDTLIRVDCQNNVPAHGSNVRVVHGAVQLNSASAVNYIRIQTDSGNISSAKIKLYGVT